MIDSQVTPGLFVDGRMTQGASSDAIEVIDPATGQVCGAVVRGREAEVDLAVRAARKAFEQDSWRRLPPADRGRMLLAVCAAVRAREDELAALESRDVGKPITQARADVRGVARYFEYYGGMADKLEGSTIPVRSGALDLTIHEPYGVSAHIIPWNFPLAMGARGIAPALAAGNTIVAKPAEDASLSIVRLAEIAHEAGLPAGVFNVVTGLGAEAGAALVRHPLVAHVTFTGSVATGTAIMKMAADGVKPVALELGGKAPAVVFADADLGAAADVVTRAAVINAGQVCNSCSRVLVERRASAEFTALLAARFAALRLDAPLNDPDLGPVNSARQRKKIEDAVTTAADEGLAPERFGELPRGELAGGFFVQPSLLHGVAPTHRAFREEIFGPILTITPFDDLDEAAALANATEYGLNAGVFSQNVSTAVKLSQRIDAGQIYVNGWGTGGGVEVPFGGYKKSGFGREKGFEGLRHYTQVKSVTIHVP